MAAGRGPFSWLRRLNAVDLACYAAFLLLGAWVTAKLWPDPRTRELATNAGDQTLYEWFLTNDVRLFSGGFSLVSDRLNAPDGVNLMANTSVIALGALFAPVTATWGAPVTFTVLVGLSLAGTAIGWYLLFSRVLGLGRLAAAIGGGFCGFAPGIVSQANGHLHMSTQWLVPIMVWMVVRLARAAEPTEDRPRPDRRRIITSALGLAAAVTVQVFIGEEVLFFTAVTLGLFSIGYWVQRRQYVRRILPGFLLGLGITAVTAGAALAYPLYMQFAGPASVAHTPFNPYRYSADLASFPALSPLTLFGSPENAKLTTGSAEYTAFFGWPLLIVALACAVWLWRSPVVTSALGAGAVMGAMSLGPQLLWHRKSIGVPGPYHVLMGAPLVEAALPMRFALTMIPLIALVLALAVATALRSPRRSVRVLVPAAVLLALLPAVPAPLPAGVRTAPPQFVTAGHWRQCVEPGGVLVPIPPANTYSPWAMRWPAAADVAFAIPQGYFIGPFGPDGKVVMTPAPRPTAALLFDVSRTGKAPAVVTAEQRAQATRDLATWKASCVALAVNAKNAQALLATAEGLFGPATRVADAWTWRVGATR
ncbi:MAG TPA: hypothetical protein VF755_24705 [Catenuloplanes sp.]|jgi:hypothetical protein